MSSGAFTSVSAKREITVKTEEDNEALLQLFELGSGRRSVEEDVVTFAFPSFREQATMGVGLGVDSVYEFDRDAEESDNSSPEDGLLGIGNQGTQPVEVFSRHESNSEVEIELYDVTDPQKVALRENPARISVGGDILRTGFRIKTFGAEPKLYDETLTIVARAIKE